MSAIAPPRPAVQYPDSDGQPMADNTVQFEWIGLLMWNLDHMFAANPDVFVAGDHIIYPVEGSDLKQAPDVYVAFGRPKRDRGSYKVWEEGGIFPQVVFEVWSPGNRHQQMEDKKDFYEEYGAEEYYILYPEFPAHADGWQRVTGKFVRIPTMDGWVSPRLGISFTVRPQRLVIHDRRGRVFRKPSEIAEDRDDAERRVEAERRRAEAERLRAEKLAAKLRELGVDPEAV